MTEWREELHTNILKLQSLINGDISFNKKDYNNTQQLFVPLIEFLASRALVHRREYKEDDISGVTSDVFLYRNSTTLNGDISETNNSDPTNLDPSSNVPAISDLVPTKESNGNNSLNVTSDEADVEGVNEVDDSTTPAHSSNVLGISDFLPPNESNVQNTPNVTSDKEKGENGIDDSTQSDLELLSESNVHNTPNVTSDEEKGENGIDDSTKSVLELLSESSEHNTPSVTSDEEEEGENGIDHSTKGVTSDEDNGENGIDDATKIELVLPNESNGHNTPRVTKTGFDFDSLHGPDGQLPQKLRNIPRRLIKKICNEIVDLHVNVRWDDIAGLHHAKNCVNEMAILPLLRPDIFKGSRSPGRGLLLFGPPGTGKTMIGKAIAGEANATFFYISASSLASEWIGVSEQLVRALFGVARCRQPAVIFVDEIDSILSKRKKDESDHITSTKTQFFIEMDGFDSENDQVLLIGATNRPQELDEAARRRLTKRLYIPLPSSGATLIFLKRGNPYTTQARAHIIKNILEKDGLLNLSTEDIDKICKLTQGYSGSDMKNLAKDAAMGPVREALKKCSDPAELKNEHMRPVALKDFEDALKEVRRSVSLTELGTYEDWNSQFGSIPTSEPDDQPRSGWSDMLRGQDGELPKKLRRIPSHLLENVCNEIMDHDPNVRMDDIAGLHLAKKCVNEMAILPLLRPDLFKGCRSPGKGLLLFGPPGTGKTMIGKAIAGEANATFFCISASSLASKWYGESEQLVRTLFGVASCRQPAVIFVDEIDSILSQRKTDDNDECSRKVKTQFLIEMEGFDSGNDQILLIGATNRPQELDEAARRRFTKRLYIPLPSSEARAYIVRNILEKDGLFNLSTEDIDNICKLTEGYSGSDMKNLVKDAAMGPLREALRQCTEIPKLMKEDMRPVTLKDFEDSLQEVRPSVSLEELGTYEKWNNQFGSISPSTTSNSIKHCIKGPMMK